MIGSSGVAFLLSLIMTWGLTRPQALKYFQDIPNHRSSHDRVVSRGGGIAIVAGSLAGISLFLGLDGVSVAVLVGATLLVLVSIFDDSGHVAWSVRILIHCIAAACLLWDRELDAAYGSFTSIASVMAIVWFINLYNFMDGSDGLAGLMALIGCAVIISLGLISDQMEITGAALILASSVVGFLAFNLPPAKIFMGDTGSTFLGFALAWLVLWALQGGIISFVAVLILFSPFWVDASITLVGRILRRERVWEAHKCHYYQRLILTGFSHKKLLLGEFCLMLAGAVATLIYQLSDEFGVKLCVMGAWLALLFTAMAWVRRIEGRIS